MSPEPERTNRQRMVSATIAAVLLGSAFALSAAPAAADTSPPSAAFPVVNEVTAAPGPANRASPVPADGALAPTVSKAPAQSATTAPASRAAGTVSQPSALPAAASQGSATTPAAVAASKGPHGREAHARSSRIAPAPASDWAPPGYLRGNRDEPPSADGGKRTKRDPRDAWLVAAQAQTRAPIDVGAVLAVETPFRLRLSAGFGWVPAAYIGVLTGIAANATNDELASAILEHTNYGGKTWHFNVGFRPFSKLGLYLDAGYGRILLDGTLAIADLGVPALARFDGGYAASTTLDTWQAELGYQTELASRIVLAVGVGAVGTLASRTDFRPVDGAPNLAALSEAARQTDSALEAYGVVPTLSLRLGFDFI